MAPTPSSSSAANIMLAVYEKKTVSVDLYRPFRNYVVFNYSEREAQKLDDDLQTLKQMRADLERGPAASASDSLSSRRDLLQKYYRSLCAVESRFPISPDKDHVNAVTFTWHDAFKKKLKASQQNIHLEKAAVLFNLGAVNSQIGLTFDRGSIEGRKQASHAFIEAASVFAFLRDNESTKASMGSSTTVDFSVECASMLERFMLAQAQECFFEHAIAKGTSPGACAKISRQVGIYYEEALEALNVAPLKEHFDKNWFSHVQLKVALFYAEACYRCSLELHEKEEIGEEIARLKIGINALSEAKKSSAKGAAQQLLDAMNKLEGSLTRNLERAVKENGSVYHMRVPATSSLPPLPALSLVESKPMSELLDASKEKMFASLVPYSSAKALSRYTEMVDDIIRTQAEKLQHGSELARVRLKEMDLPNSILDLEGNCTLPTTLKEDVEAVQISGGPAGLEAELQQLRDLRRVNQELLVQTEVLLQKEATEDAQFRSQFGTQWTRPQSSTLTKNLQDRLNGFAVNLKQAADRDARIERSVRDHSALMSILDRHPIESALPTLARPIMSSDANKDAIVGSLKQSLRQLVTLGAQRAGLEDMLKEMKRKIESALPTLARPIISLDANKDVVVGSLKQSLRQLETLGAQRAGLEDMLKEMKRKDDILPKLIASTGSHEDLFRKEIAKYDCICKEIAQNIEAQELLLVHIQAQNDDFAAIFNLEDYKASREKSYKQIEAAIAKYREIKENVSEGLKIYVTLQNSITNIKQHCSDFIMTRSTHCREMIEDVQRQKAGFDFQDKHAAGAYNYPSVGQPHHQTQRSASQQHMNPGNVAQPPRPQTSYCNQHPEQPTMPREYAHRPPPYGTPPQQPPPYHAAAQGGGPPYPPPPQPQQQPPVSHEYGQPAYPGWRGYYNAPAQQSVTLPRPPYTIPSPYPPHQSGYYKQ